MYLFRLFKSYVDIKKIIIITYILSMFLFTFIDFFDILHSDEFWSM